MDPSVPLQLRQKRATYSLLKHTQNKTRLDFSTKTKDYPHLCRKQYFVAVIVQILWKKSFHKCKLLVFTVFESRKTVEKRLCKLEVKGRYFMLIQQCEEKINYVNIGSGQQVSVVMWLAPWPTVRETRVQIPEQHGNLVKFILVWVFFNPSGILTQP